MNKEKFIDKIKDIKINVDDEYFFLEYNKAVYDILEEKEQLQKRYDKALELLQVKYLNLSKENLNEYIEQELEKEKTK